MARTISAVARSKPTQLNLSRSVSSQLRRLLGDVETGTRLGQKPGEASVAHPSITDAEDQGKHPADPIFPFMSNENLSERTDRAKQESKPSSDPKESVLHNHPPPAEDANVVVKPLLKKSKSSKKRSPHRSAAGPKVAGIGLNSRMTSPFFSTPSAGLRGRTGTVSKSLVDFKTGAANSTSRPWEMQGRLAGRKCLITGATSGIGYAIAKRFFEEGVASVTTVSRSQQHIEEAYHGMRLDLKRRQLPFHFLLGDITDEKFLATEITGNRNLRNLDILVNAAGISQSDLLVITSVDTIQRIINTNLTATIALCKIFDRKIGRRVSLLKKNSSAKHTMTPGSDPVGSIKKDSAGRKHGAETFLDVGTHASPCIINISSLLGVKGGLGTTAYSASKAGLLGLTRALVCEHGSTRTSTRVNAIVPGYIDTSMTQSLPPIIQIKLRSQIPTRRFGTPEEVADAAVFLATNEYANNCVLNLDGGLSAM